MKKYLMGCVAALALLGSFGACAQEVLPVDGIVDDVVLASDPLEGFNRRMYRFNIATDKYLLKPVSKTYEKVVPKPGRSCVRNIFENLSVPYTALNNILQGKFKAAGQDLCRFALNSTVGLGGCFNVAAKVGLPEHEEDFGQTLGVWGVPAGSFVMLPLLGPTTVRDLVAKPVDFLADPLSRVTNIRLRNSVKGLQYLDKFSEWSAVIDMVDGLAIDPYAFTRDAWLQRRETQVQDGDYFKPSDIPVGAPVAAPTAAPADVASATLPVEQRTLPELSQVQADQALVIDSPAVSTELVPMP